MAEQRIDPEHDRDLANIMMSLSAADRDRHMPPADLWTRIESGVLTSDSTNGQAVQHSDSVATRVTPFRRRRLVTVAGALAVAAAAAVAIPLAVSSDGATVVAVAALSNEGLGSFPVTPTGSARLVVDRGQQYLEVSVDGSPSEPGAYLELWLIDANVRGMVSLGPYTGARRYPVPAGVDPVAYPVVDVSVEPADGVPTHSSVSVVRGLLR